MERAYADGAHDSRADFNLLASNHVDPAIKARKNASRRAGGSFARKYPVIEQQTDFEAWKEKHEYGDRRGGGRSVLLRQEDTW